MKSIYITSVERYSGKTAACLALGQRLQEDGYSIGYLKPLSVQPYRMEDEQGRVHIADEDAAFVREILNLPAAAWELSPVVVTPELLTEQLQAETPVKLMERVCEAFEKTSAGVDVLLLEGGGSLREGYVVGLPTPEVARAFDSSVLAIVKYRDEVRLLDDALTAQARLGAALKGIIINRVPAESLNFVHQVAMPFLERRGLAVLGVLPEVHSLEAVTVGDLMRVLNAEVLTKYQRPQALVENFTVGAMTAEAALSRFRKYSNKAVITGGDRTDIQLAALETSTTCLVLTGNLRPSPLVVKQAEEFGVTMLLVRGNTMETIESIDSIYGKTRLGEKTKLKQYRALLDEHLDYNRLKQTMGLEAK
jgi:uncharacterized protein